MLQKILREPLLHFVVLGAALFVLFNWAGGPDGAKEKRIVVTPGRIQHLAAGFERTWRRPPTEQELQGLIDSHIREEIYYREALSLGLDKDDAIVRRRMMQKLEFLTAGVAESLDPTDDELRAYLERHPDAFRIEAQVAFRHVYLNPERHAGDIDDVAAQLLDRLKAGDVPPEGFAALGDNLLWPSEMQLARGSEIGRLFGSGFAEAVLDLQPGRWTGPIESGYGVHLVYVEERRDARLPALDEVRDVVLREWLNERRNALGEAFYQRLREGYTVVIDRPEEAPSVQGQPEVSSIIESR